MSAVIFVVFVLDGDTYIGMDSFSLDVYQLAYADAPQTKHDPKLVRSAEIMRLSWREWLRRGREAKRVVRTLIEGRGVIVESVQVGGFVRDHRQRIVVLVPTRYGDLATLLLRRGLARRRIGLEPG